MKVVFATDHAGFELKEALKEHVQSLGHDVEDIGAHTYEPGDDYPPYMHAAAERVAAEPDSRAVIVGGSGQGEAMAANRHEGIRAAVYMGESDGARHAGLDVVTLAREHNDANILSLGARFVSRAEAYAAVERFLSTPFSGDERHVRRIQAIDIR